MPPQQQQPKKRKSTDGANAAAKAKGAKASDLHVPVTARMMEQVQRFDGWLCLDIGRVSFTTEGQDAFRAQEHRPIPSSRAWHRGEASMF